MKKPTKIQNDRSATGRQSFRGTHDGHVESVEEQGKSYEKVLLERYHQEEHFLQTLHQNTQDSPEENLPARLEQLREKFTRLTQFVESSPYVRKTKIPYVQILEMTRNRDLSEITARVSALESYEYSKFSVSDISHEVLQAALTVAKERILLIETIESTEEFLDKLAKNFLTTDGPEASSQTILPKEEKRAIENQPYGKQPRAAEMSDKIQDAIRKGEHPGAFIQRELIGPSEQTLESIAEKLGVHWTSISYMRKGRYKLSPEMAAKLSHYFKKYTTEELLTLQAAHDAKKADQAYLASLPEHKDPTPV